MPPRPYIDGGYREGRRNDTLEVVGPSTGGVASGFGRDLSTYRFGEYTQVEQVMFDRAGVAYEDGHRMIFRGSR